MMSPLCKFEDPRLIPPSCRVCKGPGVAAALVIFAHSGEAEATGALGPPGQPSLKNSKLQVSEGNLVS